MNFNKDKKTLEKIRTYNPCLSVFEREIYLVKRCIKEEKIVDIALRCFLPNSTWICLHI